MKIRTVLLFIGISLFSNSSHAFVAFCGYEPDQYFEAEGNHVGVFKRMDFECFFPRRENGKVTWGGVDVRLSTFGPGFKINSYEGLVISCPFVSQKHLAKIIARKGAWHAVGVGASVGVGLTGAQAGVAINHRGAACIISGLSLFSFGAAAGVIDIKISESPLDAPDLNHFCEYEPTPDGCV